MGYIKAISTYFPKKSLTNGEIVSRFPEWDDQKILNKIGVKQRYVSDHNEFTSDLATQAIKQLLSEYFIDKNSIDFLIICTQSPDYAIPTTACIVQHRVGLPTTCAALDINQGCSGYVYGLSIANGLIATGNFKNIILVTADTYSKYIHPDDKGNISIFGDAATATLISNEGNYRIGNFTLGTDGSGEESLTLKNSGVRGRMSLLEDETDKFLQMKGSKMFNFIIKYVPSVVYQNIEANHLQFNDIDLFIFHQANTHILNKLREDMEIPTEKFVLEMLTVGNTVSSTLPIALKNHLEKFPDKPNNKILLAGFGVGYSWGITCIFKEK